MRVPRQYPDQGQQHSVAASNGAAIDAVRRTAGLPGPAIRVSSTPSMRRTATIAASDDRGTRGSNQAPDPHRIGHEIGQDQNAKPVSRKVAKLNPC